MGTYKRTRKNNNEWNSRFHHNKLAFDAVIGNADEPGAYVTAVKRNSVQAITYEGSNATVNPAAPCKADFCCDVEKAIAQVIKDKYLLQKFLNHYIMGVLSLDKEQTKNLEQKVGEKFRKLHIYPIGKYFISIRRKSKRKVK